MSTAPPPRFQDAKARAGRVIDIRESLPRGAGRTIYAILERPLEGFLGITRFNAIYRELLPRNDPKRFFGEWLDCIGASWEVSPEELAKIPTTGPLCVIGNHPFGGIDGMILGSQMMALRDDFLLLGNALLGRVPGIRPMLLPVNPFGGKNAARENVRSMKEAVRHLESGGCLASFPAGEVSSYDRKRGTIADPAWSPHIARLIRQSGATVIPMWFEGRNSALFQIAGLLSPRLRTALLVRELINKKGRVVRVRIGDPIPASETGKFADDASLTAFLRERTEALAGK